MNTLAAAKHLLPRAPLIAARKVLAFLSDAKAIFRPDPRHTQDEQNVFRGLASIHPAIPRKFARWRARWIERNTVGTRTVESDAELLFSRDEIRRCVASLNENGVYAFGERLPASLVAGLQSALRALPAYLRTPDGARSGFVLACCPGIRHEPAPKLGSEAMPASPSGSNRPPVAGRPPSRPSF